MTTKIDFQSPWSFMNILFIGHVYRRGLMATAFPFQWLGGQTGTTVSMMMSARPNIVIRSNAKEDCESCVSKFRSMSDVTGWRLNALWTSKPRRVSDGLCLLSMGVERIFLVIQAANNILSFRQRSKGDVECVRSTAGGHIPSPCY